MKQQTLATAADQGAGFEQYRRSTKRDVFLATMNEIVPWRALYEVIEPHYPKRGNGRPPIGLERMLRMYFIQHWTSAGTARIQRLGRLLSQGSAASCRLQLERHSTCKPRARSIYLVQRCPN